MATNVSEETSNAIQELVHDAFDTNSILDRVKTELNTTLAFPVTGNLVHMLAHKYSLDIGDGVGDLIENKNEPVNYGNIPTHEEVYTSVEDAMQKVLDVTINYQNELNKGAKIAFDNMDIHIFEGLEKIIELNDKYVDQTILWMDIVKRYGSNPSLDVHMKDYDILK